MFFIASQLHIIYNTCIRFVLVIWKMHKLREEYMENVDVIALGELLIDFTNNGTSNQGNPIFEANPGGAPCNVLSMLAKLGKKTAFIGKVGSDQFGKLLVQI